MVRPLDIYRKVSIYIQDLVTSESNEALNTPRNSRKLSINYSVFSLIVHFFYSPFSILTYPTHFFRMQELYKCYNARMYVCIHCIL